MNLRHPLHVLAALLLAVCSACHAQQPPGAGAPFNYAPAVAVIYNGGNAESKELAEYYARKRGIPKENLVPLKCSDAETISRQDFKRTIEEPLRAAFTERQWWKLGSEPNYGTIPLQTSIRVLAVMRGVPLRVSEDPVYGEPDPKTQRRPVIPPQPGRANAASVDSELALLGLINRQDTGPLPNPYFGRNEPFYTLPQLTPMFLVGRLDGPNLATAKRLVDDALAVEAAGGLYGKAYLDLALKNEEGYKIGEEWILSAARSLELQGVPTFVDSQAATLPTNFPMTDAAIYLGWYTDKANGPFLNPAFRFRPGAVACHIHSFSATSLRTSTEYWCGPLLAKGAAVVPGNVWEPYLQLTVHLDKFIDGLLAGKNVGEAAWSSTQVLSWMSVVVGDPLYRPFPPGLPAERTTDRDYKAIRLAMRRWGGAGPANAELMKNLGDAAARLKSGTIYEFMGLHAQANSEKPDKDAEKWLALAEKNYSAAADRLRVGMERADAQRRAGNRRAAVKTLENLVKAYGQAPEAQAAREWLQQLKNG